MSRIEGKVSPEIAAVRMETLMVDFAAVANPSCDTDLESGWRNLRIYSGIVGAFGKNGLYQPMTALTDVVIFLAGKDEELDTLVRIRAIDYLKDVYAKALSTRRKQLVKGQKVTSDPTRFKIGSDRAEELKSQYVRVENFVARMINNIDAKSVESSLFTV